MESLEGVGRGGRFMDKWDGERTEVQDEVKRDATQEHHLPESNKGHQDDRMAAASGVGRRRIVIVQACVDQRRDPRRGGEGGGEEEPDRKMRRREQGEKRPAQGSWLIRIGDERRNWEKNWRRSRRFTQKRCRRNWNLRLFRIGRGTG